MIIYRCDLCGEDIVRHSVHVLTVCVEKIDASNDNKTTYMTKHFHPKCSQDVVNAWQLDKSWNEFVVVSKKRTDG